MKKNLATLKSSRSVKQTRKKNSDFNKKPLIIEPYITEKSFNLIEKEKKLTFIVDEIADKKSIKQELHDLYEAEIVEVNTARTIDGKKAFAKFKDVDSARDLATKLGLV
ncbi:MAG TPA: 50S ribosomal protein L23 [Nitrososphaeraceae archaeon]|jgi:large subunit ribosomal protein L23|nr:50S ribosomal protein L23 [Nitrososphaeraceae archaeon]